MAKVTVMRSEIAKDKRNRFVGLTRRLLLARMTKMTMMFPIVATTAIKMKMTPTVYLNGGLKRGSPTPSSEADKFCATVVSFNSIFQ